MSPERGGRRRARLLGALATALSVPQLAAAAPPDGRYVELFTVAADGARHRVARVDADALPQQERKIADPQYDVILRARGVQVARLWSGIAFPPTIDLAVLRFNNGLQIPLPFRDADYVARLDAFLVRANTSDRWATLVPGQIEPTHRPPTEEDLRPPTFQGNKVVVSDAGLAPVLASARRDLRPWMYADSLAAIDFVSRNQREAPLDAGPQHEDGKRVFVGTCAFCHAVRGVGGSLGWDFLDPIPIYSDEWLKRYKAGMQEVNPTPARTLLQIHVRFRAGADGNRSMPALRGMTSLEVQSLWRWLQALAAR